MPAAFDILKSVDKFLRIYYVREMEVYHKANQVNQTALQRIAQRTQCGYKILTVVKALPNSIFF